MEPDAQDPITDDEILYRRIPAGANPSRYNPETNTVNDQAFAPHKTNDQTGLSVFRAKSKSIAEVAAGIAGKWYYVAVLRAGDIRSRGIEVQPKPDTANGFDAAHAELPDLNSANQKESKTLEKQKILAELCLRVEGPFLTPQTS